MRRSWVWLRCASLAYLFIAVGHSIGGVLGRPGGVVGEQIVSAMHAGRFEVSGVTRSYWAFYWGMGWTISTCMLLFAALLWIMSNRARTDAASVRSSVLVMFVGSVVISLLSWVYFVPPPSVVSSVAVLALVAALLTG